MKKDAKIQKIETKDTNSTQLTTEVIQYKIYIIRRKKVILDRDLAILYEVPTKRLNEAVKRNSKRFPADFMFQLNTEEYSLFSDSNDSNLKSQFATSSYGGTRKLPFAFTEQGIAMLSSVLHSERAISINIQIIRIFTKLREMIDTYKELREKVEELEKSSSKNFEQIFKVIKILLQQKTVQEEEKPKNKIGFHV